MIVHVLRLTRWEWYKLRKRWMPWILLIVALAVDSSHPMGFLRFIRERGQRIRRWLRSTGCQW